MIDQVRPQELSSWIARHHEAGQAVVLDVREPAEWRTASIRQGDDFKLLTIPMGSVPPRLSELDPETPIACLCHHGGRSMQVAQFLQNQGFSRVANIAGGIHAWADEVDNTIAHY